jgi:hypothetical protein
MGMYVSQLRSVPVGRYNYYVYLIDASSAATHSKDVDRFFDGFAKQSEVDAVIVRGPQDLSYELFQFLQTHAPNDFWRLEALFHEVTCLVISEGALQATNKLVHILPLRQRDSVGPEQPQFVDSLLAALLVAMRKDRLFEFVQSLGAEGIALTEIKDGMLVATLRKLNDALELKPNVAGVGLNLNAVIQRYLGPPERPLPE